MQVALNLEKTQPRRKEIAAELADIRARLRRQQLNAARQTMLHAIWSRIASSPAQHPR